jgi:hypothetical protein
VLAVVDLRGVRFREILFARDPTPHNVAAQLDVISTPSVKKLDHRTLVPVQVVEGNQDGSFVASKGSREVVRPRGSILNLGEEDAIVALDPQGQGICRRNVFSSNRLASSVPQGHRCRGHCRDWDSSEEHLYRLRVGGSTAKNRNALGYVAEITNPLGSPV